MTAITILADRTVGGTGGAGAHDVDKLEFLKSVFISAAHIHYDATTGDLSFLSSGGWQQPVDLATLSPHLHIAPLFPICLITRASLRIM
jgi:hypothetical protein